jgi:hypothetical protein
MRHGSPPGHCPVASSLTVLPPTHHLVVSPRVCGHGQIPHGTAFPFSQRSCTSRSRDAYLGTVYPGLVVDRIASKGKKRRKAGGKLHCSRLLRDLRDSHYTTPRSSAHKRVRHSSNWRDAGLPVRKSSPPHREGRNACTATNHKVTELKPSRHSAHLSRAPSPPPLIARRSSDGSFTG